GKDRRSQETLQVTQAKTAHTSTHQVKTVVIIPIFREIGKIGKVLGRFEPGSVDQVCVVADDPNEAILAEIENARNSLRVPFMLVRNPERKGIGFAIRQGFEYALSNGFEIVVVMAGNGKDDPRQIPRLTQPVLDGQYDYVQGSRFLPGGQRKRNPFLR